MFAAAILSLCAGDRSGAQQPPALLAQRPVQFAVHTIAGDTLRVGPREPATLIAIFATWCRSCKDEVPQLNQLKAELATRGVRVVAVNVEAIPVEAMQRWLTGQSAVYAAARDESGEIARALGVVGVPEFHLISSEGRVVFTRRGPLGSSLSALRSAIASLPAAR